MDLKQALTDTEFGRMLLTAVVSMIPILELRGGIPFGTALGLTPLKALAAGVVGNMVPIPFIIVYIRRVFLWLREHFPGINGLVDKLERKAHLKGNLVTKYKYLGLFILVAIPLPGTGGWTGALVAALLDMRLRRAVPAIFLGVLTAGLIMTFLTRTAAAVLT